MRHLARAMSFALLLGVMMPMYTVAQAPAAQTVQVATDTRAEVLAIMFRLADASEYTQGRIQPYIRQIDSTFGPFKNHAAIREIARLRKQYEVSYDAVMSMAAHVTDPITFGERTPFDSPTSTLDKRWHGAEARPFLQDARDFARDAHVAEFLRLHAALYDSASVRLQRLIDEHANTRWFNAFFGEPAGGTYIASPLLANAGGNFGPSFDDGVVHERHAYLGIGTADSLGFPTIPDNLLPTLVHEFNHSFVNHVVETQSAALKAPGERIYNEVSAAMRAQAYSNWQTMMNESVVRAAVIRYLLAHDGQAAADREARSQRGAGFIWIDELVALLGDYESNRATYPTLTSFMPKIVGYYEGLGQRIDSVVADLNARRPSVTASSIADGATDVDASTPEIVVRFDRKMGKGVSISRDDGEYPVVTGYGFDSTGTAFTLHVKLETKHKYAMRFTGLGFASAEGFPLKEYVIRFSTR